jgi:hypothetical protein
MLTITNYRPKTGGACLGTFSVSFPTKNWGTVTYNKLSYFKKDNQRWVSMPSETYEKDGKKKYAAYIYMDNENFKTEVLKALDDFLMKQSPSVKDSGQMASQFVSIDRIVNESFL